MREKQKEWDYGILLTDIQYIKCGCSLLIGIPGHFLTPQ